MEPIAILVGTRAPSARVCQVVESGIRPNETALASGSSKKPVKPVSTRVSKERELVAPHTAMRSRGCPAPSRHGGGSLSLKAFGEKKTALVSGFRTDSDQMEETAGIGGGSLLQRANRLF